MIDCGTMSGPCCICGATNYALSMGGPTICPSCDCGNFGLNVVQRQGKELAALRAENAAARGGFLSGWNAAKHRALDAIDHHLMAGGQEVVRVRQAIRAATEGENNGPEAYLVAQKDKAGERAESVA